ncbi:integrin beta pat-3-like [Amphiura filiformis]|uniref:integrin beta pat-3-like n=1 Tax=Amphiura filiformis TaxID=82378 RepID=UPI003B217BF1
MLSSEQCDQCSVAIATETTLFIGNTTEKCLHKDRTGDNCTAIYAIETFDNGTTLVHVQKEKDCHSRRAGPYRPPVDIKIIVLAIVASIVLIGLALLFLLRLAIYLQDRAEYSRFEKERKKAQWDEATNPLFRASTKTYKNPMYGK